MITVYRQYTPTDVVPGESPYPWETVQFSTEAEVEKWLASREALWYFVQREEAGLVGC